MINFSTNMEFKKISRNSSNFLIINVVMSLILVYYYVFSFFFLFIYFFWNIYDSGIFNSETDIFFLNFFFFSFLIIFFFFFNYWFFYNYWFLLTLVNFKFFIFLNLIFFKNISQLTHWLVFFFLILNLFISKMNLLFIDNGLIFYNDSIEFFYYLNFILNFDFIKLTWLLESDLENLNDINFISNSYFFFNTSQKLCNLKLRRRW